MRQVEDGDWHGNDTVWRMVLDLNTLAVDMVCARMMGLDINRIPTIRPGDERDWLPLGRFTPEDLRIHSNVERWRNIFLSNDPGSAYTPSAGWRGYVKVQ